MTAMNRKGRGGGPGPWFVDFGQASTSSSGPLGTRVGRSILVGFPSSAGARTNSVVGASTNLRFEGGGAFSRNVGRKTRKARSTAALRDHDADDFPRATWRSDRGRYMRPVLSLEMGLHARACAPLQKARSSGCGSVFWKHATSRELSATPLTGVVELDPHFDRAGTLPHGQRQGNRAAAKAR